MSEVSLEAEREREQRSGALRRLSILDDRARAVLVAADLLPQPVLADLRARLTAAAPARDEAPLARLQTAVTDLSAAVEAAETALRRAVARLHRQVGERAAELERAREWMGPLCPADESELLARLLGQVPEQAEASDALTLLDLLRRLQEAVSDLAARRKDVAVEARRRASEALAAAEARRLRAASAAARDELVRLVAAHAEPGPLVSAAERLQAALTRDARRAVSLRWFRLAGSVAAGLGLLAALAFFVYTRRPSDTAAPAAATAVRVEAVPWGRIRELSETTRGERLRSWDGAVVPAVLMLEPGRYELVVENEAFAEPVRATFEVSRKEPARVRLRFPGYDTESLVTFVENGDAGAAARAAR